MPGFPYMHKINGVKIVSSSQSETVVSDLLQQRSERIDLGPFITNSFGDRYLYSVNRNIFNQEGSQTLYRRKYPDIFTEKDHLHIIIGSDSGLLIHYCKGQERPKGSRYIFLELPEVIHALDSSLIAELPESISVFSYDDFWQQKEFFYLDDYILSNRLTVYSSFCAEDAYLFEYRNLQSHFEKKIKLVIREVTTPIGITPFTKKTIDNVCDNRQEAAILENCFAGKSAVVLGGGPSLDDILPWLKENLNKVVIFAVSRICRQLFAEGITPHIIVAVDPQEISFDFCKEMFFFEESSLFIHAFHASSCLINQWGGLKAYTGFLFPWESSLNCVKNSISGGTTVTNLALELASFMGCSQVILGGVDFCFGDKGFSHSSGSDEYKAGPNLINTLPIETNNGQIADTIPGYYQAKQDMDNQTKRIVAKGLRIINPSPYSAKIANVEYIPIQDIELVSELQDPMETIRAILPKETLETRQNHYNNIKQEIEDKCKDIEKISILLKEALLCNNRLSHPKKAEVHVKSKKRMDQIEKELKKKYKATFDFIRSFELRSLLKATSVRTEQESWSSDEANEFMRTYYSSNLAGAKKTLSQLKGSLKYIEIRLEEEKKTPNIEKLICFWEENNQCGRAKIWRKQHREKWQQLEDKRKELIRITEEKFIHSIKDNNTEQRQKRRQPSPLTGIPTTALEYFKFKDNNALTRLAKGLEHHPDKETATKLFSFVKGLQYELKKDTESALTIYESLISDGMDFLTEDVLRRIFSINIEQKQYEGAFLAMECLTNISITYAPFFARFHELTGDKLKALEIYTKYIEQVGIDLSVMNKMAKIYEKLGVNEGAELMYNTILEKEPDNNAALNFFKKKRDTTHK